MHFLKGPWKSQRQEPVPDPRLGLSVPCKTHSVITAVTLYDVTLLPEGSHGVTCSNKNTHQHISQQENASIHQPLLKSKSWDTGPYAAHSPNHRDPSGGRPSRTHTRHITLVRAQAKVSLHA